MPLIPGTRLGPYEVTTQIGVGGMGEVYVATDTNLKRLVAIKVLPASVAGDAERLARFQREAEVLAALNHPNIAAIYGLERSEGTVALVMELVEGDDLSQRIARGALPLDEALPIAKQIAEALEAAHEQGIIHRDLKPANVKVRQDGTVKVLDFGLAKEMEPVGVAAPTNLSQLATITSPAFTQAGMILGTAAYMSPEQARSKPVDKRSDIWAFGCVLYEMLTGQRAFPGEDVAETIASVVKSAPDQRLLPPLPPLVGLFLIQSLAKTRVKGSGTCASFGLRLKGRLLWRVLRLLGRPMCLGGVARGPPRRLAPSPQPSLGPSILFVTARSETRPSGPIVRFEVSPPPGSVFPGSNMVPRMEISPDGEFLAITMATLSDTTAQQLFIRRLDDVELRPVTNIVERTGEPVQQPFWSPDSRTVGFFVGGTLRRINRDGTAMRTLTSVPGINYGGAWSPDGATILYTSSETGGVRRVAASGGNPVQVTSLDAGRRETGHYWPQFLPDGRHFIYFGFGTPSGIYVGSVDSPERKLLTETPFMGRFAPPGYMLFLKDQSLVVQRFEVDTLSLTGDPTVLVDRVQANAVNGRAGFSVSATGVIAYRRGTNSASADSQLTWTDRTGREIAIVGDASNVRGLDLADDGAHVVFHREDGGGGSGDVWLLDLERNTTSRVTFDPEHHNVSPIWTPGGKSIVFSKTRGASANDSYAVYAHDVVGAGNERLLFDSGTRVAIPCDVSPDGSTLIFNGGSERESDSDLWTLSLANRVATPYLQGIGRQFSAQFSPDGKWVAYVSNESGRDEVYVQSYPQPTTKYQVSTSGGTQPRWRGDGLELFFRNRQSGSGVFQPLMAVPVERGDTSMRFGLPSRLFSTAPNLLHQLASTLDYDATSDGRRFLRARRSGTPGDETGAVPVTVLVHWREQLAAGPED